MGRKTGVAAPESEARQPVPQRPPARWVLAGVLIWLSLVGAGMAYVWRHALTPGQAAQAPGGWPAASALRPAGDRTTLLMWCHPRCPCTRASLEELAELVQRTKGRAFVQVSFVRPPGCSEEWVHGALWRQATAIPGVRVVVDDGSEARRFGVRTSGQTLIFGQDRHLLFSGGLTASRGHVGESEGLAAATRLARAGAGRFETTPVFGCALLTPKETRALDQQEERR